MCALTSGYTHDTLNREEKVATNEFGGVDYVCLVNYFGLYQPKSFRKALKGFTKECSVLYWGGRRGMLLLG